jgi:hypothetical protein
MPPATSTLGRATFFAHCNAVAGWQWFVRSSTQTPCRRRCLWREKLAQPRNGLVGERIEVPMCGAIGHSDTALV